VTAGDDVVWQQIEGETVLLAIGSGRYYRLDPVGSRMWALLHELGDIDRVRERLLAEFEVDPERLGSDLEALVDRLAEAELVTVEPRAA
jgi:Coenzyme PQQ synthesis protein D (PqqD)